MIDWSWNIFTLHNFFSLLIKQLIDLENVKTDNLKFRTDLPYQVMDGCSVTLYMIVYKEKLLRTSSNRNLKLDLSTLVTIWLSNITFHLRPICLQTLIAIDSELRQTSFPSICAPQSQVAVLFNSNLSRHPFLGQVVDSDLPLCTRFDSEHAVLILCHISTQRPMNDCKIERSDRRDFSRQHLLSNCIENFISHEKKSAHCGPISTKHEFENLFDSWTKSVSQEW